jgi:DNA-binding NarL/FixJ family response regulator
VKRKVLLATPDTDEGAILCESLSGPLEIITITSPRQLPVRLDEIDCLLLDHKFTDFWGVEFMTGVLAKSYLPVLVLTPPHNPRCAIDAIRAGAYNILSSSVNFASCSTFPSARRLTSLAR